MDKYNNESYKEKYPFDVDFLKKAYIEEERTLKQMCTVMDVSSPITVRKILNAYGISTNDNARRFERIRCGMSEEQFKEYIISEYCDAHRQISSIAAEFDTSYAVIAKYLQRYGVKLRDRKEQFNYHRSNNYQGGRHVCSNGYVEIIVQGHPATNKRGYVYEHRVVMEKLIGRYLESDEVVHHINGKKTDNTPSNLILLSNSEHCKLHSLLNTGLSYEDAIKEVRG